MEMWETPSGRHVMAVLHSARLGPPPPFFFPWSGRQLVFSQAFGMTPGGGLSFPSLGVRSLHAVGYPTYLPASIAHTHTHSLSVLSISMVA